MESLIWKYIDGECNSDEKAQVEHLLKTDLHFSEQFKQSSELNLQLQHFSTVEMSEGFRQKMENKMILELAAAYPAHQEIITIWWKIGLSLAGIGSIILALKYSEGASVIFNFIPEINARIITMGAWVAVGFVLLISLDNIIGKWSEISRTTGMMV
ncbi:MAG: hypothetical protein IPL08_06295 [Saprospiraceae bacterium]|nr:hypothetical protein [Saprospiraceae bacterium]MBK8670204.1 hypothetical protein [Saprospiraceae bacterium]